MPPIAGEWARALQGEFRKPYYRKLFETVGEEYRTRRIYPPADDIFNAFHFTPLDQVKVVILGQDPYHEEGQAHGLCFSVRPGVEIPPSLVNIYKELEDDLGCYIPNNGYLEKWARQGVMLLNTVLTVRAHQAHSHKDIGWEEFTDAAIRVLAEQDRPMVFILWGKAGADEEGHDSQSQAPDTGGSASEPPVCLPWIFRQPAFFSDKRLSEEKWPGTHRLAD